VRDGPGERIVAENREADMVRSAEHAPGPGRRSRRVVVTIAAAVVVVLAVLLGSVALLRGGGKNGGGTAAPPAASTSLSTSASPLPSATGTASESPTASVSPLVTSPYQPLWPFHSVAQARDWQLDVYPGGHDPGRLDAGATALEFTRSFLGFTGVDRVVGSTVTPTDARVTVGFATTGSRTSAAAVIHLVPFGAGAHQPWEVVGTEDIGLTLTTPRYGATVSSPLRVGGRITGVDENIRVQVRQVSGGRLLGTSAGVPAGGENTPWSATVPIAGATDQVVTVVATTGGHLAEVERFAVTGVRLSSLIPATCAPGAFTPLLAATFDRPGLTVVDTGVATCRNGYAKVFAVPRETNMQHEQVYLRATPAGWEIVTYGSGISCADQPLQPSLVPVCRGLSQR
jgi:hypothetical protein